MEGGKKIKEEQREIFIAWVLENKKMVSDQNSFVSTKPEERRIPIRNSNFILLLK